MGSKKEIPPAVAEAISKIGAAGTDTLILFRDHFR